MAQILPPVGPLELHASLHTDHVGVAGDQLFFGQKVGESAAGLQAGASQNH